MASFADNNQEGLPGKVHGPLHIGYMVAGA